jgi:hypothetical protein
LLKLPLLSLHGDNGPGITVDMPESDIYITFEAESDGEPSSDRVLTSSEARALASMLVHFAAEAER